MIILGLDTGLAGFGYAVADYGADFTLSFLAAGAWETKPGVASKRGDDTTARWMRLYRQARALAEEWRPGLVVVEAIALPWGRTSMVTVSALGRARAIADAIAVEREVILLERTAQALKREATGNRTATKEEVQRALVDRYPTLRDRFATVPEKLREHAADAAAAIHAIAPDLERRGATWE